MTVSHTGLVLTGGGARSAYQVGALRALAEILGPGPLPFQVIAGISAGAINSVVSRHRRRELRDGVGAASRHLVRADAGEGLPDRRPRSSPASGRAGSATSRRAAIVGKTGINYLLDPAPLRRLLETELPFGRMRRHLRSGRLRAIAVSATNYHTGSGVTFFEGSADIEPGSARRASGSAQRLTLDHVMASAAIPFFFPPVKIDRTFYGDGCVRMSHPISPAIHLGAERILAISARHLRPPAETARREAEGDDKTDHAADLRDRGGAAERGVPRLGGLGRRAARSHQQDARAHPAGPAEPARRGPPPGSRPRAAAVAGFGKLAARRVRPLPGDAPLSPERDRRDGAVGEDLLSYLAFEPIYLKRVIDLGHADTLARRDELEEFFLGQPQKARARG